jgi:uncharacterized membrane protein
MDATHLHLALAHFPIIGAIIGAALLAYGLFFKNREIQKVALATFIGMALLTIPVFLTGEEAEEAVEHLPGFSEQLIENHEELAEKAIWLMGVLGVLALVAYYAILKQLSFAKILLWITFIISLATFGVFAQVGNLGGQIRHSEIRAESTLHGEQTGKSLNGKSERQDDRKGKE